MNKNGKLDYEEKIKVRIAALKDQREKFVEQANQQLAALNGAIAELEALIEPETEAVETQ